MFGVGRPSVVSREELRYLGLLKVGFVRLLGCIDCIDLPISKDYLNGKVKIDEYVTHHRNFLEINEGFHDMHVRKMFSLTLIPGLTEFLGW